jgi:hypothetical protein
MKREIEVGEGNREKRKRRSIFKTNYAAQELSFEK